MSTITPYLFFNGNCREALNHYKECFGGELQILTYGDAQGEQCPIAQRDQVMHGSLIKGELSLMASDDPVGAPVTGTNVQLSFHGKHSLEMEQLFTNLAKGGKVNYPLHDVPWGAKFGTLTDRFGMHWMFNLETKS